MMNKNILRNGDMVVMNNGKKATYMVVNGTPIFRYHTDKGSFSYVNKYSNDLVHPSNDDYTVNAIYRVGSNVDAKKRNDAIFNPDKMLQYGVNIATRDVPTYAAQDFYADEDFDTIDDILDTKTGDMVLCANGKFGTVFRDVPDCEDCVRFHTDTNSFMPFKRWDGLDHKTRPDYNIDRVYRADTEGDPSKLFDVIGHPDKMADNGVVIFDRNAEWTDVDWDICFANLACGSCTDNAVSETKSDTTDDIKVELLKALQTLIAKL